MNLKELKNAFIILKSQKLINTYDIDIDYKDNDKIYKTFFERYDGKSYFVNFGYNRNKENKTGYIKNLIYENYIKN